MFLTTDPLCLSVSMMTRVGSHLHCFERNLIMLSYQVLF